MKLLLIVVLLSACNSDKKKTVSYAKSQDPTSLEESIKRGEQVYADMCITCHLPN